MASGESGSVVTSRTMKLLCQSSSEPARGRIASEFNRLLARCTGPFFTACARGKTGLGKRRYPDR
jgi:hypothetical protein